MTRAQQHWIDQAERWALWTAFFLSLGLGSLWVTGPQARAESASTTSQGSVEAAAEPQAAGTVGSPSEGVAGNTSSSTLDNDSFNLKGLDRFGLNYFFIFYGPSVGRPSIYQPLSDGAPDMDRPILFKNFATLSYTLSRDVAVSGTAFWYYQPVLGQNISMRDPYLRISHDHLFQSGPLNLYADLRVHFGVSGFSRNNDQLTGIQTFQILSFDVPNTRLQLSTLASARLNIYGSQGFGPDVELYLGPGISYQATENFELTLLYEMGMSHFYGDPSERFYSDGTALEPGFRWQITPNFMLNPYVNLYPSDNLSLNGSSFGMMFNWTLL